MADYNIGSAYVQILPSFAGVVEMLDREARKWGVSNAREYAGGFNDEVRRQIGNTPLGPDRSTSARQGTDSGGAFADGFKARVEAALRALPPVRLGVAATEAEQKLRDLRVQLEELSKKTVGVDIDSTEAIAEIDRIKADLERLSTESSDITVRADTTTAIAQLDRLRADIDRLSTETPDITVRANTGDADARLAATRAEADSVGRSDPSININVISGPALYALDLIKTAILGLSVGAVITPLIGGAAALLGPIAAVGAGLGGVAAVGVPAITNVKNALDAQTKAQNSTTQSTTQSAAAQQQAAQQIKNAELSLADTQRRIANDRITSAEQVKRAQESLASTEAQVAQQRVQDARAVATAEASLTQANTAAANAQQALNDAREQAARDLESSANSAVDANLSQQQAVIDLANAQANLAAVNASASSTDLQKQQAALDLAKAQENLVEANERLANTTADNTKAQKAGVDGSPGVVAAQQNITNAAAAQAQALQALQDAKAKQVRDEASGSQQIRDAEQAVADARRQSALQAAQDASELTRAQAAVAQAQLAAAAAATAGSSATNSLSEAMAKLSPQEQDLLAATEQFKSSFRSFGTDLQPAVIPVFAQGLQLIERLLPIVEPLIRATAEALQGVVRQISAAVTGGGFKDFVSTLTDLVGPALRGITTVAINVGEGIAHLIEAFAPLSATVGAGLEQLSSAFANATRSPAVAAFVKTIGDLGPLIVDTFKSVGGLGASLLQTLAPLSGPVLTVVNQLARSLSGIVTAVGPSITQLFRTLAPAITGLLQTLAPAIESVVRTLAPVIGVLGRDLAAGLAALTPALQPVATLFGEILRALSPVLPLLGQIIGQLLPPLAALFTNVVRAVEPFITQLVGALQPVIPQITAALSQFLTALQPLFPIFTQLLTSLIPLIPPLAQIAVALLNLATDVVPVLLPILRGFTTALSDIIGVSVAVVQAIADFLTALTNAGTITNTVWQYIKGIFDAALNYITGVFTTTWSTVKSIVTTPINDAQAALSVTWTTIRSVFSAAVDYVRNVFADAWAAVKSIVSKPVNDAEDVISTAWTAIRGVFQSAVAYVRDTFSAAWQVVRTVIVTPFTDATGALRSAWASVRDYLTNAFSAFADTASRLWTAIANGIGKAFGAVRGLISGIFDDVESVFVRGANFVTQSLLKPLVGVLNDVLSIFGLKIPVPGRIPDPREHHAHGGIVGESRVIPGYAPGQDTQLIWASPGEGVIVPEAVRGLGGPAGLAALNAMFSSRLPGGDGRHFAAGGTVPPLTAAERESDIAAILAYGASHSVQVPSRSSLVSLSDGELAADYSLIASTLKSGQPLPVTATGPGSQGVFSSLADIVRDITDALRRGAADAAIAGLKVAEAPIKAIIGTGDSRFANSLAGGVFNKLNTEVFDYIRGHVKAPPVTGSIPTGQHLQLIKEALGLASVADTAANEAAVNTIVSHESGWNASAINLTDSNAAAGHPSQGLMQTIPSTFEAYRLRSLPDDIDNPIANLVAGIRYAVANYGSLSNVPGVRSLAHGGPYVGYDSGGYLPPGISAVYNGTGKPEPVFTSEQWSDLHDLATRQAGFPSQVTLVDQDGSILTHARVIATGVLNSRVAAAQERSDRNVPGDVLSHLAVT